VIHCRAQLDRTVLSFGPPCPITWFAAVLRAAPLGEMLGCTDMH
jgi:hypothetical protein